MSYLSDSLKLVDLSSTPLVLEKRNNALFITIQSLGEIRYGTYQSEEHIIIPVVSQVGDTIVSAVNGPGPELIPSSVLSLYPEQRNGRPIVMGHPQVNNEYVFANSSTEVLESYSYGIWMNNYYDEENKRIKGELWLSKSKAEKLPNNLSSYALDVIDRVSNGKTIEVSEGNWVISEKIDGVYNGQSYIGIWRLALTDHIATLKSNEKGACGVTSHGCGAGPYVMEGRLEDKLDNVIDRNINLQYGDKMMGNKVVSNIRSFIRSLSLNSEHKSDNNLRTESYLMDIWSALYSAIQKVEPGFSYIDDIEVDNKLVIYAISTIEGDRYYTPSEITLYERSYTIDENNKVTLSADRNEVVYVKNYVRVSSTDTDNQDNNNTNNDNSNRSTNMANDTNAVNAVKNCTCGSKPIVEGSSTSATVDANANVAAASTTPISTVTEPISNVNDLINLPNISPELKAQLTALVSGQQKEKENLINSLLKVQQEFSKEDLTQMDLSIVRRLAKVSGVVTVESGVTNYDFSSSRSINDPNASKRTQAVALPDPWGLDKKTTT
jgi:hypothetical protein